MAGKRGFSWGDFWAYVGYGVSACVLLAIPLIAIDWLLKNLPGAREVLDYLAEMGTPVVAVGLGLVLVILLLAILGFVLRQYLWDRLSRLPVLGTLMTSGQQLAKALASILHAGDRLVLLRR